MTSARTGAAARPHARRGRIRAPRLRLDLNGSIRQAQSTPRDRSPVRVEAEPADLPLFREQIYHALSRQDAALWADLGTYRA